MDFIFIQTKNKGKYKKINFDQILYLEAMLNYSAVYTLDGEKITFHITLKEILENLPSNLFIRIHKSFIVSLKQINFFGAGEVTLLH